MKVLIVIFYLFKASLLNKSINKKQKDITANCPQTFERIGSSLYSFIIILKWIILEADNISFFFFFFFYKRTFITFIFYIIK